MQFWFRYPVPIAVALCGLVTTAFSSRLFSLQGMCCVVACSYVVFHILEVYVIPMSLPDRCSRSIEDDLGDEVNW